MGVGFDSEWFVFVDVGSKLVEDYGLVGCLNVLY